MSDNKIHIWAKKVKPNSHGVIKLSPKAHELLVDVVNESGRSMKDVASQIIIQAIENELIVYDREEEE